MEHLGCGASNPSVGRMHVNVHIWCSLQDVLKAAVSKKLVVPIMADCVGLTRSHGIEKFPAKVGYKLCIAFDHGQYSFNIQGRQLQLTPIRRIDASKQVKLSQL